MTRQARSERAIGVAHALAPPIGKAGLGRGKRGLDPGEIDWRAVYRAIVASALVANWAIAGAREHRAQIQAAVVADLIEQINAADRVIEATQPERREQFAHILRKGGEEAHDVFDFAAEL